MKDSNTVAAPPWLDYYDVTEDGTVTSRHTGRRLRPTAHDGYHRVRLLRPTPRQVFVHVLVLERFVGPCPPGMECRHLDGDRQNNRLANLAWGTDAEQAADRDQHGTTARGEGNGKSVLTAEQVRLIRTSPLSQRAMARQLGVSRGAVASVRQGKTWGWL